MLSIVARSMAGYWAITASIASARFRSRWMNPITALIAPIVR
jgi:hypothetical protein